MNEEFKKGDKVTYLGNPAEITFVGKDQMDRTYYSVAYDKGNGRTKTSNLYNKGGEIKSIKEMDINDPVMMKMRAAKDKLAKMRAANAGDDGNDKFFDNAKKIAFLKKEREQLMRDMEQEAEPEGGPIADEYGDKLNRIDRAIAKLSGRKEMTYDQAIAEGLSPKDFPVNFTYGGTTYVFNKIAKDRAVYYNPRMDGDTASFGSREEMDSFLDDYTSPGLNEYDVYMPSQEEVDKFFALTNNETHYLNSKPVMGQEGTFNLMPIEPWDEYDLSNWNSLVRKAKAKGKSLAEMKVGDKVTFKSGGDDMEIIGVRDMFASDLKAYRVKNADGETFEYSEDQLQLSEASKGAKNYFDDLIFNYQKAFRYLESDEKKEYQRLAKNYFSSLKESINENALLKQAKLSSAEYQKAKKLKDFNKDNYKWNPDESLYVKLNEAKRYSTYEIRMVNQIRRAKKDGEPMYNLPLATQNYYRKNKAEMDALVAKEIDLLNKMYDEYKPKDEIDETYASSFGGFRKELDGETIENELQAKGYETPSTGIWNKILVNKNGERVAMIDTDESSYTKDGKSYQWSGTEKFISHVESISETDDREDDELSPEELANKYAGSPFFKENLAQTLAETIKLGEGVIEEELCPKGKAYIKRRKAAGEKSSAYLSGRAVKVCKGQMSGRKKRKSKKK